MATRWTSFSCCWKGSASVSAVGALVILHCLAPVACNICKHRVPGRDEISYKVHLSPNHFSEQNVDSQLRVKTIYDTSVENLLPEKRKLVKDKLFPQAVSYLQKTFQVRKPSGTILLSRQCVSDRSLRMRSGPRMYCNRACAEYTRCGPVLVPEEHLQQCMMCSADGLHCGPVGEPNRGGVEDADFILYVSALSTERCGQENIATYAAYCQLEVKMDRPIAGYTNLCPNMISTKAQEFVGMLSTVKHEILHALGFSAGLFAFYYDDNGNPWTTRHATGLPSLNPRFGLYQWSNKVVRKAARLWDVRGNQILQHDVLLLVTPRVVEEARKHFNCPVLEGMELENQGVLGTAVSHWEKRLLENEAMTGSLTQNRVFSRITLALMEDTGWYRANYSMAEKLDWGRNKGCDFAMKSCKFWIDLQRTRQEIVRPYCDTLRSNPLQLMCREDQRAVAVCNLQKYPNHLPQEYQYFDHLNGISTEEVPYYGGAVQLADFCPFGQEFSWHLNGKKKRGSDCRVPENQPDPSRNYAAETYGPNSVCLILKSDFTMEQCIKELNYPDWGSGCYQIFCSSQGLKVWFNDTTYICGREGQKIAIDIEMNNWVYTGNLICPACLDFCESCPPEYDPPPINKTRIRPIGLCSRSSSLVVTLWLLLINLLPLLLGFLLCAHN
ncbi:leishmanolysin-like peptidase [Microcaecilia unicolor]|uniref:Leishmanolysin-like peptidase n=1 Tax=Microcaecilia unicolor TaxID=1415580 RepID=A0A6P7YL00_9AMPH|nr:leishmanolysin-like peptidase [Microcaecilia unicolor]